MNELQSFENQLILFTRTHESNLEFRRMALVHSFQDLVNSIPSRKHFTGRHIKTLESLSLLPAYDKPLFREIGIEMLESVIRLQIICGGEFLPQLASLASILASQTSPLELTQEVNEIILLLSSSNPRHPLEQLSEHLLSEDCAYLDIFKSVVSMYVPHILQNLLPSDLGSISTNFDVYLNYISSNIQETHACLGTPAFSEVLDIVRGRKVALKFNAFHACLRFLLKILVMYEEAGAFPLMKKEVVEVIAELYGDFLSIFEYWSRDFTSDLAVGIAILGAASISEESEGLEVPYVLSGVSRLQIYLPLSIFVHERFPSVFFKLFSHAVDYMDREFKHLNEPLGRVKSMDIFELFAKLTDLVVKQSDKVHFEKLVNNFKVGNRFHLLSVLLRDCQTDEAKATLIDIYTGSVMKYKEAHSFNILNYVFQLRPISLFGEAYLSALKLMRLIAIAETYDKQKLFDIYRERIAPLYQEISDAHDIDKPLNIASMLRWTIQEIQVILQV